MYNQYMKSILQTKEWATLRQTQGWKTHWVDEILVLEKPLPLGLSFLYAPEVDFYALNIQKNLSKIKEIAKNSHSIFIRLDFLNKIDVIYGAKITKILKDYHFVKAFEEIQPEYRQIVDISKSEDQILAQMKQKGRYNIRVAQKHNIVVEKSNNIKDFYQIFQETAQRDGFEVRPQKYFEKLVEVLGDNAALLVARLQDQILAATIVSFHGETASYLYGASGNEHRETMAPYLLHWEAMREAKARGCKVYDLLAVSPFGDKIDAKLAKKYAGITRFKEQFGGQKVHLAGSWDLVLKPTWYQIFKMAEKIRRK